MLYKSCKLTTFATIAYLREEGVEAVNLLPFLHKGIVLSDTLECELVHQVDDVGLPQELVFERLHSHRKSGGVQQNLPLLWHVSNELLAEGLEFWGQQFVCLQDDSLLQNCRSIVHLVLPFTSQMHRLQHPKSSSATSTHLRTF